jgi:hypothetical protein
VTSVALALASLAVATLAIMLALAARRQAIGAMDESAALAQGSPRLSGGTGAQGVDPRAVRDLAMVRYDALEEMSGQLSFSVALLNALGDGVVMTSINGRSETRTYAKAVVGGHGMQELSPEEEQAVRAARMGNGSKAALAGRGGRHSVGAGLAS